MIDAENVYLLTDLGNSELAQAGTSLSPAELQLLVLIDGKASVKDVQANAAHLAPGAVIEVLGRLVRSGHIELQGIDLGDFFGAGTTREWQGEMPSDSAIARGVSTLQQDGYVVRIARHPPTERKLAQGKKPLVMLVEDEQRLADNMRIVLTREGFAVRIAANREQIVAALRQPPLPDLVLLDVMLPDANGFEVLAKMRQHPMLADVPVVMVTGTATREAVLTGLMRGANGYITKPFQIHVLIKAVKTVLGIEADRAAVPGSAPDGAESARPGGDAIPGAPVAKPAAFVASPGSLLARLRQAALAKRRQEQEEQKPESKEQMISDVSEALKRAFLNLKELAAQLELVKPAYEKEYTLAGVPDFDELKWDEVRADFGIREISLTTRAYEQVTLNFRLSANKKLSVTREAPADEKLERLLEDTRIRFTTEPMRNDRGALVSTMFVIPCEVRASLHLIGNFDTGKLLLKIRNVGNFGTVEHVLAPEIITEEWLRDLSHFILGESRRIGPLLMKSA